MVSVISYQKGADKVSKASDRTSKWAFIVYPDSAPTGWKKILEIKLIPIAISPLHSPDPEGSGEEFKAHYHVMLDFSSVKSYEQVLSISVSVNGSFPIRLEDPGAYFRYMAHLDQPKKQQFEHGIDDIECLNGFDKDKYSLISKKQLESIFREICDFIDENNITEYSTLVECSQNTELDISKYFSIIISHTIFFNSHISSRRNRIKKSELEELQNRIIAIEEKLK